MPFVRKSVVDTSELARLGASAAAAEQALIAEVARLRHEGASWLDIADALGTARQNAWRKYQHYRWDPEARQAFLDQDHDPAEETSAP